MCMTSMLNTTNFFNGKDIPCIYIGRANIAKVKISPHISKDHNQIPFRFPSIYRNCSTEKRKADFKMHIEMQRT